MNINDPRVARLDATRTTTGHYSRWSVNARSTNGRRPIFTGLRFYFLPNNDIHMGRRFRIRRAVEHGATWERQWSTSVTHVIADSALTYQQVIDIQAIPENVVLVNENWPARCMASRGLVSPDDPMSRVERVAPAPNVDYGMWDPVAEPSRIEC